MTRLDQGIEFALAREDLAYHQIRVLILVSVVSATTGHSRKLDGLTKLAKLDFLVRYPALSHQVLDQLQPRDGRLHLSEIERLSPTEVEAPMTRYKYGPWDDRYYAVLGALVGRGLLRYVKARKGSMAVAPTPSGRKLAEEIASSSQWCVIHDRAAAIAEASANLTGNALKELIYERLEDLMDRPYREVIR